MTAPLATAAIISEEIQEAFGTISEMMHEPRGTTRDPRTGEREYLAPRPIRVRLGAVDLLARSSDASLARAKHEIRAWVEISVNDRLTRQNGSRHHVLEVDATELAGGAVMWIVRTD